jgi:hypothetical protein
VTLWAAVDGLVKPRSVKLFRDDGAADWTVVPSLWAQLEDALSTGMEGGNGTGASKYRTPVSLDVLELTMTIREVVIDALAGHDCKPLATFPGSVRRLASLVVATTDEDLAGWWRYRIQSWCRQIDHVLRLTMESQPRRIRDARCPTCAATHVTIDVDGEKQRVPALLIDFADGLVRCAFCSCCGATYWRGEQLLELAERTMRDPRVSAN